MAGVENELGEVGMVIWFEVLREEWCLAPVQPTSENVSELGEVVDGLVGYQGDQLFVGVVLVILLALLA